LPNSRRDRESPVLVAMMTSSIPELALVVPALAAPARLCLGRLRATIPVCHRSEE